MRITITVNGTAGSYDVDASTRLLDLLREDCRLTGVKEGCSAGECGACTVLVDDAPVCSCLMPAVAVRGKKVTTIEGLAKDGELNVIQRAFLDCEAVQCGFCTPGMVLSSYALLKRNTAPTEQDVRHALSGNICRCTGYVPILAAVLLAAERLRAGERS